MTGLATRDDYVVFCEGVRKLTKIDLLQYKRAQMERRIRTIAERRGVKSLAGYLDVLGASAEELDSFLDRVTINVSQLWRNPEQWDVLERHVLPDLAKAGRIKAWSAGCSYGAEAHTLAAVCLEACPGAKIEIVGTDIDRRMVERARAGGFSEEDARTAPRSGLNRWFTSTPAGWQARPELRRHLRFDVGDLLNDRFPAAGYDLILCRNVVIYFAEDVRNELHNRLASALRPGGYLIVGATERVAKPGELGLSGAFSFTYRKA
jgi:chemotaxis protein methyltransferase CheR